MVQLLSKYKNISPTLIRYVSGLVMLQRYFRAVVVSGVVLRVVTDKSFIVVTVAIVDSVLSLCNTVGETVKLLMSSLLVTTVTVVSDGISVRNSSSAISLTGGFEVTLTVESVGYADVLNTVLGKGVSVGIEVKIHWLSLRVDTPSGSTVEGGWLVTSKDVL